MRSPGRRPVSPTLLGVLAALCCLLLWQRPIVGAASGRLEITVVDQDSGQPIACRMHLNSAAGRHIRPKDRKIPYWHDHFVIPGKITLTLPLGHYTFEMERGPEYSRRTGHFTIDRYADDSKELPMRRFVDMPKEGWYSGDLEVHRSVVEMPLLMEAEDLHVVPVVTWWDDRGPPHGTKAPDELLVSMDDKRCYHIMAGGHDWAGGTLLLLNLSAPLRLSARNSEYPPPAEYLDQARRQAWAWADLNKPFWWDLPMLVADDRIDSIQIAHSHLRRDTTVRDEAGGKPRDKLRFPDPWGNAQWSQAIYFHLLNCGVRIPPSAGSGSGKSPNPPGYNRVYVHVGGQFSYQNWWKSFKAGRVTLTNGPLLRPKVHGQMPGHVFHGQAGQTMDLEIGLTLSTREPISYLEIIKNGQVEHSIRFDQYAQSGRLPKVQFAQSGWFLIRAVTDLSKTYRFAMTGPYYVQFDYQPRISKQSAQFFLDWVYERARQIRLEDPDQQHQVLEHHRQARDFWRDLVERANAQ